MVFRVDADLLQLGDAVLRRGDSIAPVRDRLGLRKGRAATLTNRIHGMFCALAAARVYRSDGWLSFDEVGQLDGWAADGSVARQLANEFEIGTSALSIVEQQGRGADAQLRLRIPAAEIQIGELPEAVQKLFGHDRSTSVAIEDLLPQPIVDRELAVAVAGTLRDAGPELSLQVRPAYQGGRSSLVFRGLALRGLGATRGHPAATAVLVKVPLGVSAGKLVVSAESLAHERKLLAAHAGWPGLPPRVDPLRIDLRALGGWLRQHRGVQARDDQLTMDALVLPLGHPRTVEAEPRLVGSIIDETASPIRRLSRRDIHNVLTLAEQLARLLRMLHRARRAHRHVSVDAVFVRYQLGMFENVLAPDLAASVQTPRGTDDLLYRDLFDLGRLLVHVITGSALSRERQNFQPPEFPGRRLLKRAVVGEGEAVARLLFGISRYLLEAFPEAEASGQSDDPTVRLLDHFLDEIEHIDMLHWARARGVPERRISLAGATAALPESPVPPREVWARSAADPVATRLVTISHLVDVSTLRRWCERYVTSHRWHLDMTARRDPASSAVPPPPDAETCLEMMRDGFGRSAAAEMWRYLWSAGPDVPADHLVRVLRNYATHWTREERLDISHSFGDRPPGDQPASGGLGSELDALKQASAGRPERELFVAWLDALKLLSPRNPRPMEQRREAVAAALRTATEREATASAPDAREYERLRSWLRAGALVWQLQSRTTSPPEKDIVALERTLQARSSPEIAFWHILLARAWAASAAHGARPEAADEPAWDKAMRALLVAAGVASSRRLPFEMAATLLASAALSRLGLSTPELRAQFSSQGVDEESVRVQAAECALLAADAYQWLDAEAHHWGAVLEAAGLLRGSQFPERLIQAFQLIALARNNRVLHRALRPPARDAAADPLVQFETYPVVDDNRDHERRAAREAAMFQDAYRAWLTAPGRIDTSDDPGAVVAEGYFSRHVPGIRQLFEASSLQVELDAGAVPGKAVDRLFELVDAHYAGPVLRQVLDLGCGAGDDARHLARTREVWAVDAPLWFTAARPPAPDGGDHRGPRFIAMDPVEYARRVCSGTAPDGSPDAVDVVLFRCSLCRVAQRGVLLEAARRLLRPGGLVIATDWIQTRTCDRITWSKLVGTGRFVDLETEPGYRRLCDQLAFTEFVSWDWTAQGERHAPAMWRWFQRRLEEVRRLEDERGGPRRSPYERAFLLRMKRDLETFTALSTPDGPLGWLFWAARKPLA